MEEQVANLEPYERGQRDMANSEAANKEYLQALDANPGWLSYVRTTGKELTSTPENFARFFNQAVGETTYQTVEFDETLGGIFYTQKIGDEKVALEGLSSFDFFRSLGNDALYTLALPSFFENPDLFGDQISSATILYLYFLDLLNPRRENRKALIPMIEEGTRGRIASIDLQKAYRGQKPELEEGDQFLENLESELKKKGLLDQLKKLKQWPIQEKINLPNSQQEVYVPPQGFQLVHGTYNEKRSCKVLYVREGERLIPRLVYLSITQGVLRVVPEIVVRSNGKIRSLGKGKGQPSVALTMENHQKLLPTFSFSPSEEQVDVETVSDFLISLVGATKTSENVDSDDDSFFSSQVSEIEVLHPRMQAEFRKNTTEYDEKYFLYPELVHLKDANPNEKDKAGYIHLKHKGTFALHPQSSEAKNLYFFESSSFRYFVVERVNDGAIGIGAIEPLPSQGKQGNSYLVPENYVGASAKPLLLPPLESIDDITANGGGGLYKNPLLKKFEDDFVPVYIDQHQSYDTRKYLEHFALIRAFKKEIRALKKR